VSDNRSACREHHHNNDNRRGFDDADSHLVVRWMDCCLSVHPVMHAIRQPAFNYMKVHPRRRKPANVFKEREGERRQRQRQRDRETEREKESE
jgi:hypothetical protein